MKGAFAGKLDAGSFSAEEPRVQENLLHIVHVVLSMDCGGLEHVVLALSKQAMSEGHKVSVVCLERPGQLADRAESLGASVHCLGKRPGVRLSLVGKLRRLFEEISPDVVHTHQVGALFYAGPAARRAAGSPCVLHTEHGKHYAARWRTRLLGRFAARYADAAVGVSRDIVNEMVGARVFQADKVSFLPNGVDTQRFMSVERQEARENLGISKDAFVVGTVGRLSEVKRQDLLIRAFAQARRAIPNARLLIVGDGPERQSLERLCQSLGVSDAVHFAGYQAGCEQHLSAMDVFALTSRSEGMPLSVIEAWSSGAAVVASRVGGLPEMIDDGRTGLLYDFGKESEPARHLIALAGNAEERKALGEAGRTEAIRRYDLCVMARAYQSLYRELLDRRGRRVRR